MRSLTPLLSIIIAILIFVFLVQPKYEEAKRIRNETAEYDTATKQYTFFNARVQDLLLKRDAVKVSDRERLDLLVPKVLDETRVLVDIENMMRQNNLLLGRVETKNDNVDVSGMISGSSEKRITDGAAQSGDLLTSDLTFDVIGEYADFKNFLRAVESSLTIMHVTKIKFSQSDSSFQIFTVTVRTYALPSKNN